MSTTEPATPGVQNKRGARSAWTYRSHTVLEVLVVAVGAGLVYWLVEPSFSPAAWMLSLVLCTAGFLAAGWRWQGQWVRSRRRITIDEGRREIVFEHFRVSPDSRRPRGFFSLPGRSRYAPRFIVPFDELLDVYDCSSRSRRWLHIVTPRGALHVPLNGLMDGAGLFERLQKFASSTPSGGTQNDPHYQFGIVGTAVSLGGAVVMTLLAPELALVWWLVLGGMGVCCLISAWDAARRHRSPAGGDSVQTAGLPRRAGQTVGRIRRWFRRPGRGSP